MKDHELLRAILPELLIDNFEVSRFEKTSERFDIWLDEKRVQIKDDKRNSSIISYGYGDYREIKDFPLRGRATYLHLRKCKWMDRTTGEVFSYDWEIPVDECTRLNDEFVAFLKEGD